jgi:hypothetical protein
MPNSSTPPLLAELDRDVRVSWRSLRRDPVFAIVALITLAVGIGAIGVMPDEGGRDRPCRVRCGGPRR